MGIDITTCEICGKAAIVGMNTHWYCMPCFDKAMAQMGKVIKSAKKVLAGEV